MKQRLALVALVVRDYDEAIAFFTDKLGFVVVQDEDQPLEQKRWVVVAPSEGQGQSGAGLLLSKARDDQQLQAVGRQSGGRVFLFLQTDDFERDYTLMQQKGVRFVRPPATHSYGTVAVFEDLYSNLWDLIEYSKVDPQTTS